MIEFYPQCFKTSKYKVEVRSQHHGNYHFIVKADNSEIYSFNWYDSSYTGERIKSAFMHSNVDQIENEVLTYFTVYKISN